MSFSAEKFDALVAQAEDAAARFDGRRIAQAIGALDAYMQDVVLNSPTHDPQQLNHIRERLKRYQGLCAFLKETLHKALMGALQAGEPACYKNRPGHTSLAASHGAKENHLAPLIRRYC